MNSISVSSTTMSSTAPTKRVAKKTAAPAAATPAAAPEPVAAPAATPAPVKAKRVAKAAAVVETPPPVVAPVADAEAPAPVADAADSAPVESSWNEDLVNVTANLSTMRETLTTLLTQVKRLEKKVVRTVKDAGKRRKARKVDENGVEAPKRPTVFKIPQMITDDLNGFLGQASGTLMSRADVTKAVTGYAKANKLMEGHNINADAKLTSLLKPAVNLKVGERLNIFNLQRCLRDHYVKPSLTASA